MLEGKIAVNLSYYSNVKILRLVTNKLGGMIPLELRSFKNLVQLNLTTNNLTGVAEKHLIGTLAPDIGLTLPNL
ncbi:LRR domain containing protein [Parasponia andersonii]|uniref:LRR domain containing protein n=1 Tax=Parasponia andersonii TaxID=3476 RepID=A0A2P5ASK3_PARAD|nr:LRR domain containing protein [Parasponia andersonii]